MKKFIKELFKPAYSTFYVIGFCLALMVVRTLGVWVAIGILSCFAIIDIIYNLKDMG